MKEFMMIFRNEKSERPEPTPEQFKAIFDSWQDWIGGIAAQGKFVSTNALGTEGKLINASSVITDGPYAEVKEIVGGYAIVKAADIDEAVKLAEGCPMFAAGGTVEVRDVRVFE